MRTLLIDNYDSFTYNLFQLLWEVNGAEPTVVRNDEATWDELAASGFDSVVISPGPGRPDRARDFGICAEAIRRCEVPLLGVCLGHQGLGWIYGGRVARAPLAMHGRIRAVEHSGSALFAGIPARFQAVRYHSLRLSRPLPDCLEEIAWSDDGTPMAVAHRTRPQWGVQFHPESVAAEHGTRLLANFRDLSLSRLERAGRPAVSPGERNGRSKGAFANQEMTKAPDAPLHWARRPKLRFRRLDLLPDPELAFADLFGASASAFWLDSSRLGDGARFSFIGNASGPLGATISYEIAAGEVTVERGGSTEVLAEPILDYLDRELRRLRPPPTDLPFDFACGFAGYFGYELKTDCLGGPSHRSAEPDAAFILADRMIAFDHELGHTYLLCLVEPDAEGESEAWREERLAQAEAWIEGTAERLAGLADPSQTRQPAAAQQPPATAGPPPDPPRLDLDFRPARSRERYLEDIAACEQHLAEGESYEVCLTNTISTEVDTDPLALYRRLRRINPAPYSAYLRFGELAVLSSSPERFLAVDREGEVEARPIKGTSRRGADPEEDARLAARLADDEKNRAENLMIVDLLRNDLGSVCEVGSVEVPALMEVESYETVHQLVSTVRGRLRTGLGAADCVRACFPPGSMTGAPKLRTTEIIDELEGAPRGIYSGAIGYLGLGGGCDLSVTIRTIVLSGGVASIGAGGAIVLQSDPEEEFGEMLLKAAAPLRAIDPEAGLAPISLTDQRPGASEAPPATAHNPTS
jgi:para-aminobenzoate synthetase